jgi:glycosyltransferase involved in cell wall biosynthesis
VVDTLDQMIETVKQLKENPELLQSNSRNAIELAKQFDWKDLIKDWEMEILKLIDNE